MIGLSVPHRPQCSEEVAHPPLQKQPLNQSLELAHCSAVIGSEPMKPLQDPNPVANGAVGEE